MHKSIHRGVLVLFGVAAATPICLGIYLIGYVLIVKAIT